MKEKPVMTGACCPKNAPGVTQLELGDDGHSVGIRGLDIVFEQLLTSGQRPHEIPDGELVDKVRAARNYIPSQREVEAKYAAALRRAYAAFCARRQQE